MTGNRQQDEALLMDFHLGACDEAAGRAVRSRLESDDEFRRISDDIANALSALALAPPAEPPEDLVARTVARVAAAKRTDALLAKEGAARGWRRPTFALRELAVAAAAILVLGVIFVPSLRQARRRSLRAQCAANVGQIGEALGTYASGNNELLPIAASRRTRWLPAKGQSAASNSVGLFKLVICRYTSPVQFQCPAVGGGSFTVRAGMVDFPAAEFISYSYQHALGHQALSRTDPRLRQVQASMAILADKNPLFAAGRLRKDRLNRAVSENHSHTGQNVLYLDMHVDWATGPDVGVMGDNIFLSGARHEYVGDEGPVGPTDSFLLPAFSAR